MIDHEKRRYTPKEAEALCPEAKDCNYAQGGGCTLAQIPNFCSIYKEKLLKKTKQ